jgi:hypothetical protein
MQKIGQCRNIGGSDWSMGAQDLLVLEVIAKVEAKKLTRFDTETLLQVLNRTLNLPHGND